MNVSDIVFLAFLLLIYFLTKANSTKGCNQNAPHLASETDIDYLVCFYQDLLAP